MGSGRLKFIAGGVLILAAVILLIFVSMNTNAEYFMTVDELHARGEEAVGQNLRISGAVVGSTIQYDADRMELFFEAAHVPGDNEEIEAQGGLSLVLHEAVIDPERQHITIVYQGAIPDLLSDEAQVIATGHLGEDGIFYADELLLKCPTKYEQALPEQVVDD